MCRQHLTSKSVVLQEYAVENEINEDAAENIESANNIISDEKINDNLCSHGNINQGNEDNVAMTEKLIAEMISKDVEDNDNTTHDISLDNE